MSVIQDNEIREAIRFYVHEYLKDVTNCEKGKREENNNNNNNNNEMNISNSIYEDIHKTVEMKVAKSNESVYSVISSYVDLIRLYIK